MKPAREPPLLTLAERLLGALLLGLCVGLLLFAAYALNQRHQSSVFEENAANVERDVAVALDELGTLLGTLVGTHGSESGYGGADELLALSERLRERMPHVSGVGRYAVVDHAARALFERDTVDSGLYDFRITAIDPDGHARERGPARRYHPITLLEPMPPERLRLVGADLGTVPGLGAELDAAAANDEPLATTLPAWWPAGGELLLLRPAYRGKHTPDDAIERLRQSDGGYWLAADLEAVLAAADGPAERFDLALAVEDRRGRHVLLERVAAEPSDRRLSFLYPRAGVERRWRIGDGTVVLTLGADIGVPTALLATLAAVSALLLLSFVAVAAHLRERRRGARERRRGLEAVLAERERAERTLNAIDDAVITLDASRRLRHLNPAAARLVGLDGKSAIGADLDALPVFRLEGEERVLDLGAALDAFDEGGPRDLDLVPEGASDGADETVLRLTLTRAPAGTGGHILVLRDISAERGLTRRLVHQANHDALTGCTNRRYFETRLGELLADMPASARRHALLYIDLDQFKIVNDTCGHAAGDRLLQELTVNLRSLCRRGDVLSRLGGDEFGLIIVDAPPHDARRVANTVLEFFRGYAFRHGERTFAVRASIGFVPLDETSGGIGDVLAAADLACYAAKEGGRNGLYVYAPDDETLSARSSELERLPELQVALAEDRFELHAQAVARIGAAAPGGRITHFEFLLRLADDEGRPIAPFRIIEAAERYGLMREIDRWVISRALAMVAAIDGGPGRDCGFSINLSGQSAADPSLSDFIEEELVRHRVDPARIWFELTETATISHFSIAVDLARRIRALGAKVALDDFGSGLSSFGYLKNIPVDVLKIDGQFVREIAGNAVDRSIVRSIAEVGRSIGLETVAEFVEDQAIVDALIDLGVDYAQGYHIGKPCPLPEALATLETPAIDRAA